MLRPCGCESRECRRPGCLPSRHSRCGAGCRTADAAGNTAAAEFVVGRQSIERRERQFQRLRRQQFAAVDQRGARGLHPFRATRRSAATPDRPSVAIAHRVEDVLLLHVVLLHQDQQRIGRRRRIRRHPARATAGAICAIRSRICACSKRIIWVGPPVMPVAASKAGNSTCSSVAKWASISPRKRPKRLRTPASPCLGRLFGSGEEIVAVLVVIVQGLGQARHWWDTVPKVIGR